MGFYTVGSAVRKQYIIEKIGLTPKIHFQEKKYLREERSGKMLFRKEITLKKQLGALREFPSYHFVYRVR